jgi:hypothetical protein
MTVGGRARVWRLAMALALALSALGPLLRAQEPKPAAAKPPLIPAENHPWARFPAGSWTLSRTTKESYDARGVATTSVEEVRTVLKSANAAGYTLTTTRAIEIGGRRLSTVTQEQTVGLSGERADQEVESVKMLGETELVFNGRKIPCEVRQAVLHEGEKRTTVKVFYSPEVRPHALRREWTVAQGEETAPATIIEEVVSIGLPYLVVDEVRSAAFRHTLHKQAMQTKESIEVICDDVPGGIVATWLKELDANGKLIQRTTQELTAYQVQPPAMPAPGRSRMIDRKRARRADEKMGMRREP